MPLPVSMLFGSQKFFLPKLATNTGNLLLGYTSIKKVAVIANLLRDMFQFLSRSASPPIGQVTLTTISVIGGIYKFRATINRDVLGSVGVCYIVETAPLVDTIGIDIEWIGNALRSGGKIPRLKPSMKVVRMRRSAAKL